MSFRELTTVSAPFFYGRLTVLTKGGVTVEPLDLIHLLSDQQPRRLRVIENLLRGRRTVSTLYWGQRYGLLYLLDLDKALDRGGLDVVARQVVAQKWATWVADEQPVLQLTAAGVRAQVAHPTYQPVTWERWSQVDLNAARQRLLLAIQVVSEYVHQTKRYYPLATDLPTRQAVRSWFYRMRRPELASTMLQALQNSLEQLPEPVAAVTTAGLTGFHQPGLTTQQLAGDLDQTAWEVYLMHVDAVVTIAAAARQPDHPLNGLLATTWTSPVTRSAQATLAAVTAGSSLDQVAHQRKIKPSTAREHLLEAAIMLPLTAIPYQRLIPPADRTALLAALPVDLNAWEYTALSPELQHRYDFFTFRLLAIWEGKRGAQRE